MLIAQREAHNNSQCALSGLCSNKEDTDEQGNYPRVRGTTQGPSVWRLVRCCRDVLKRAPSSIEYTGLVWDKDDRDMLGS